MKESIPFFNLVDASLANELNIDVSTYISTIQKTSKKRQLAIIGGLFSEEPKMVQKAKRIFWTVYNTNKQ